MPTINNFHRKLRLLITFLTTFQWIIFLYFLITRKYPSKTQQCSLSNNVISCRLDHTNHNNIAHFHNREHFSESDTYRSNFNRSQSTALLVNNVLRSPTNGLHTTARIALFQHRNNHRLRSFFIAKDTIEWLRPCAVATRVNRVT